MIVVADTSPINYLILIGHIEILPRIYREIVVPESVLEELRDLETPATVREWLSARPEWLKVDSRIFQADFGLDRLDRGERDAILLAEAIGADRLIMDDLDGRRAAENRSLAVIGTLGILAEAGVAVDCWTCRMRSHLCRRQTSTLPQDSSKSCCEGTSAVRASSPLAR